jgi:Tfp pilus assembly protein PilV
MHKLSNKGETIVEVMIAIAIVGGVLSGAYYLLNQSSKQSQAAVERTAGVKAAEAKVEILRTFSPAQLSDYDSDGDPIFCISNVAPSAFSSTNTDCKIDRYTVTAKKLTNNAYEIKAVWDGLLAPKESAIIYYQP